MPVSVLLLTHNEEANLTDCLRSLAWCDDIVVLDSGSTDRTLEIARQFGARTLYRPFDDFASQRNYGIDAGGLRHNWIFHLDADERVPNDLRDEILSIVENTAYDAFQVASRLIFQGRWLRRAGLYPSYQVRLGRKDVLRFVQVGHGQREQQVPLEKLGVLEHDLHHLSFNKGLADWIEKHNRYSSMEAAMIVQNALQFEPWSGLFSRRAMVRRRSLKAIANRLPWRPAMRFFYMYFLRLGFLDGRSGFAYCRMMAMYELMIALKVQEHRLGPAARTTALKDIAFQERPSCR
jgi:glycosyltransferase involved in cell wall biosynthesis